MSVLIKGMKMPEDCLKCPFCLFAEGYWKCLVDGSHADFGGTCRPSLCPLIELPPHGRLIDADALRQSMYHEAFETDSPMQKWDSGCWIRYKMFERLEGNAPTVIEAEVSE